MELLITEKVNELPLGIFVKFRYTLAAGEDKVQSARAFRTTFAKASIMTLGYEEKDKLGAPTHPHIHLHMLIDDKIANIRGRLKTLFKTDGEERKGNELYSLTEETDVLDVNRFFRYPWKQGGRLTCLERTVLLKDFDIEVEIKCAMEEYSRSCQFNNDKLERSTRANTYDKIKSIFVEKPPTSLKEVVDRIRDFYIQEGLACNASTMAGYATTYSLSVGLLDKELFSQKLLSLVIL